MNIVGMPGKAIHCIYKVYIRVLYTGYASNYCLSWIQNWDPRITKRQLYPLCYTALVTTTINLNPFCETSYIKC